MSRRRGDRDIQRSYTGGDKFHSPNGTLPRGFYRDVEPVMYNPAFRAVYPILRRAAERAPEFYTKPTRSPAKQVVKYRSALRDVRFTINEMPSRVAFCVRRKQRREVLFAKRKAGYSGSVRKSYFRRTISSRYGC